MGTMILCEARSTNLLLRGGQCGNIDLFRIVQHNDITTLDSFNGCIKREQVRIQKEEINARDRMGQTALILGCQLGNLQIIEELISIGADVDAKAIEASDGYTALHY